VEIAYWSVVFGLLFRVRRDSLDALKWATFSALLVVLTITDLRETAFLPELGQFFFGVGAGLLFQLFHQPYGWNGPLVDCESLVLTSLLRSRALFVRGRFVFGGPRLAAGMLWVVGRRIFPACEDARGMGDLVTWENGWRAVGGVSWAEANANDRACRLTSGKCDWLSFLISVSKKDRNYELPFWYISGGRGHCWCCFFGTPALQWYQSLMAVK